MGTEPVVLVNVLKAEPSRQADLIALLKRNIETVVSALDGWRTSRLIVGHDGASVIIYSEWDTQAAVDAMRADPGMRSYFPQILEIAKFDSIVGEAVLSASR